MENNLGIGVMIRMLGGNKSTLTALKGALEKTIKSLELKDDELFIRFDDNTGIVFSDQGQSCCEHRYMTTDDNLADYVGSKLTGAELKEAPDVEDEGEVHEVQFLEILTSNGALTMASHNEHNGYYGGFSIEIRAIN